MPPGIGAVATSMALATADEGGGMPIPARDGVGEALHERLGISRVLAGKRASLDDALQRLGEVSPGAGGRRGEQEHATLGTSL